MKRSFYPAVFLFSLVAASASAQVRTVTLSIDGDDVPDTDTPFFNISHCADEGGTEVELQLPTFVASEAWVFITTGTTDCKEADNRDLDGGSCREILEASGSFDDTLTFSLADLTDGGLSPSDVNCESSANTGSTYTLWVFGAQPDPGVDFTGENGSVDFKVDVEAPNAPTSLPASRSGESFKIEWEDGNEGEMIDDFKVYDQTGTVDSMSCSCTGSCLMSGDESPGSGAVASPNKADVTISANTLGLAVGDATQLFVSGIDEAGNEGVLSTAVCVTHVLSAGFCETLEANGEKCPDGCSATPLSQARDKSIPWIPALSVLAAVLWLAQRRRSAL